MGCGPERGAVVDVELTLEESTVVQQALRTYCSDLRMEIVDTDNPAYRRELKEERAVLEGVLAKLDSAAAANAVPVERTEHVVIRLIGVLPTA